jgi:hypothetical protein
MATKKEAPVSRHAKYGKTTILVDRASAKTLREVADFEARSMSDVLGDMATAYVEHVLSADDRRLLSGLVEARSKYDAAPRRCGRRPRRSRVCPLPSPSSGR